MTTFPSLEALEQPLDMGMEEGMKAAIARIDDVLAACDGSQLPFGKAPERVRD